MVRRCGWCGRYIPEETEPISGINWHGEMVTQTLCPTDAQHWRELIEMNEAHDRKEREEGRRG